MDNNTNADSTPPAIPHTSSTVPQEVLGTLRELHTELVTLNQQNAFSFNRITTKVLLMQFLKGTCFALGSLVGAAIVISILLYILSQMEVIPIVGEWIKSLNDFLKMHQ